ncbi:RPA-interacting protein-like isoform X1 [Triticum dicoccoides]|uniref:RPA-interacting protein-like isoform X1 n=1 Tax=Triticum dicoccoides TaxID=85692 RepID=UPI000E7AAD4F|nr:RPA-interacting protein-like isoform X1 [Triticum dicoccoides]
MDSARPRRVPNKSRRPDWREELRENCMTRVKNERVHLLWKMRNQGQPPANDMKTVESAVRNIISDEVQKLKGNVNGKEDQEVDMIWEYEGPQEAMPAEYESEDMLLEMERLLYEDLREEMIRKEIEALDEEDAYLAQAVFEHMQLKDEGVESAKVWCPVCKQGELRETHNLIHCTLCKIRLDLEEDKVNLDFLRERLAKVHMEHLDRGCTLSPKFCLHEMFGLNALYIRCDECSTFEVVV